MRPVDTNALLGVARALGIGNPATLLGQVEFDDDVLQQALVVNDSIRRARNGFITADGMCGFILQNAHGGAGTLTDTVNPYDLAASLVEPYLSADELEAMDVWVLPGINADNTAAGLIAGAVFRIIDLEEANLPGSAASFPIDLFVSDGSEFVSSGIKRWLLEQGTGLATPRTPAYRVPRGAQLTYISQSTGITTTTLRVPIGVFPAGLGQDAVGTS